MRRFIKDCAVICWIGFLFALALIFKPSALDGDWLWRS